MSKCKLPNCLVITLSGHFTSECVPWQVWSSRPWYLVLPSMEDYVKVNLILGGSCWLKSQLSVSADFEPIHGSLEKRPLAFGLYDLFVQRSLLKDIPGKGKRLWKKLSTTERIVKMRAEIGPWSLSPHLTHLVQWHYKTCRLACMWCRLKHSRDALTLFIKKVNQAILWSTISQIISPSFHVTEVILKKGSYTLANSPICVKMLSSNQTPLSL